VCTCVYERGYGFLFYLIYRHLLIAFGGPVGGLQEAIEADQDLKVGGEDAAELFDLFIDPNAKGGTRTVRLEVCLDHMYILSE
jgi:hypothetical protein